MDFTDWSLYVVRAICVMYCIRNSFYYVLNMMNALFELTVNFVGV